MSYVDAFGIPAIAPDAEVECRVSPAEYAVLRKMLVRMGKIPEQAERARVWEEYINGVFDPESIRRLRNRVIGFRVVAVKPGTPEERVRFIQN